jgi:hypothetical protein
LSDKQTKSPNFILPPVFGGEIKESQNISAKEMEFRRLIKQLIKRLSVDMEIDAPDIVIGLVPIAFEVCLEHINLEHYEEALESYHELWHEFFSGILELKNTVARGFIEANHDLLFTKKSRMDWS